MPCRCTSRTLGRAALRIGMAAAACETSMKRSAVVIAVLLLVACATTPAVDLTPQVLTGEGADVRIEAEIAAQPRAGEPIAIAYAITNERAAPITIAEVTPQTTFDLASSTATIKIGLAAPGATTRLVRIAPGEKKSFRTVARLAGIVPTRDADPRAVNRTMLRLQVNFVD